jgi:hypothetical protein
MREGCSNPQEPPFRAVRGGSFGAPLIGKFTQYITRADIGDADFGFRVATIVPEPGASCLGAICLAALLWHGRLKRQFSF